MASARGLACWRKRGSREMHLVSFITVHQVECGPVGLIKATWQHAVLRRWAGVPLYRAGWGDRHAMGWYYGPEALLGKLGLHP